MSHKSGNRKYEDNEGNGPRPPVPGRESHVKKMTEGAADIARRSPPSYHNWALTLNHLLDDSDGAELFTKYVEEEFNNYFRHVKFYFACEGLKVTTNPKEIQQIIHMLYRTCILKGNISIPQELRDTLRASRQNKIPLNPNIYDPIQQNVFTTLRDKIYPEFLRSEMYIAYIQRMSTGDERCSGTTGSGSGGSSSSGASYMSGAIEGNSGGIGACALSINSVTNKLYNNPSQFVLPTSNSYSISECRFTGAYPPTPITIAGACSASGSVYGPSTSASSSGSISAQDTLPRSSTLPTLHEETELVCDDSKKLRKESSGHQLAEKPQQHLTRELLLATQTRRLDVRPSGAHGYNYQPKANSSYVPNSCVDSERASVSSGGRTDSETKPTICPGKDGRPNRQRHEKAKINAILQSALVNKETDIQETIPRPLRQLTPRLSPEEFAANLNAKLEKLKLQQDDDNDHILEEHILRVWPPRSPISPRPPLPHRRAVIPDSGMLSDSAMGAHSMKHSKSMPDHSSSSRKIINKWPSMNTDSGISLFSSENSMKVHCSGSSRPGSSTTSKHDEARRRLEEEPRKCNTRRSTHQLLPASQINDGSALRVQRTGSTLQNQHFSLRSPPTLPPPLPAKPHEPSTVVIYTFCDEKVPFKATIPGKEPTLKQFKDCLPKKGNFKFYFQLYDEDPVTKNRILIQEEIKCDSAILPLLDGKVRGQVMPSD